MLMIMTMDQEGHNHIDNMTNRTSVGAPDVQNMILLLAIFHQRKCLVEQMAFVVDDQFWCGFFHMCKENKWAAGRHELPVLQEKEYLKQQVSDGNMTSRHNAHTNTRRSRRNTGLPPVAPQVEVAVEEEEEEPEEATIMDNHTSNGVDAVLDNLGATREQLNIPAANNHGDADIPTENLGRVLSVEERQELYQVVGRCDAASGIAWTRNKFLSSMLHYVWVDNGDAVCGRDIVLQLIEKRNDYTIWKEHEWNGGGGAGGGGGGGVEEDELNLLQPDPRVVWAWQKFPHFHYLWYKVEILLGMSVGACQECEDGDLTNLLRSLPIQLIHQIYHGRWKLARATSTFMRRMHEWLTHPVFEPLVNFLCTHCKMLFQDALIEHVNSCVARLLKAGKKLTVEQVQRAAHQLIPTRETRKEEQQALELKVNRVNRSELSNIRNQYSTSQKHKPRRTAMHQWLVDNFCKALSDPNYGVRPVNVERVVLLDLMYSKTNRKWGLQAFLDQQQLHLFSAPNDSRKKPEIIKDLLALCAANTELLVGADYDFSSMNASVWNKRKYKDLALKKEVLVTIETAIMLVVDDEWDETKPQVLKPWEKIEDEDEETSSSSSGSGGSSDESDSESSSVDESDSESSSGSSGSSGTSSSGSGSSESESD